VQNHFRQQAHGDGIAAAALLPPQLGRSPGRQVGCPCYLGATAADATGGTAPFCSYHFSPCKNSTLVPGPSIPGSLRFASSFLRQSLGPSSPAWSLSHGTAKLGFVYVLEKP